MTLFINGKTYETGELIAYVKKLEKENAELKGEADSVLDNWCRGNDPCLHLRKRDDQLTKAKGQIEKVEYTLKKIIETVHNDRIDEYGARLVLIYDFASKCLEEIEK